MDLGLGLSPQWLALGLRYVYNVGITAGLVPQTSGVYTVLARVL